MTGELKAAGECLTGLAWGFLQNRTLPKSQLNWQFRRLEDAILRLAHLIPRAHPNCPMVHLRTLKNRIFLLPEKGKLPDFVEILNLSNLVANQARYGYTVYPELVLCPNLGKVTTPTALIPSDYSYVNAETCTTLFLRALWNKDSQVVCTWLNTVLIEHYIDPKYLQAEHIQFFLDCNPTCGARLLPFCKDRDDLAAVLYFNNLDSFEHFKQNIEYCGRDFLGACSYVLLEQFGDKISKSVFIQVSSFKPRDTAKIALSRRIQNSYCRRVIWYLIDRKIVDGSVFSTYAEKFVSTTTDDLSKIEALNKVNRSVKKIIASYMFSEESFLLRVLEKLRNQVSKGIIPARLEAGTTIEEPRNPFESQEDQNREYLMATLFTPC